MNRAANISRPTHRLRATPLHAEQLELFAAFVTTLYQLTAHGCMVDVINVFEASEQAPDSPRSISKK